MKIPGTWTETNKIHVSNRIFSLFASNERIEEGAVKMVTHVAKVCNMNKLLCRFFHHSQSNAKSAIGLRSECRSLRRIPASIWFTATDGARIYAAGVAAIISSSIRSSRFTSGGNSRISQASGCEAPMKAHQTNYRGRIRRITAD
jgi:hypothetical protein